MAHNNDKKFQSTTTNDQGQETKTLSDDELEAVAGGGGLGDLSAAMLLAGFLKLNITRPSNFDQIQSSLVKVARKIRRTSAFVR